MRRRVRRAAPIVSDRPVREVAVDLAWMHRAARADKIQQSAHVSSARRSPGRRTTARMHQDLHRAGHEAVVHEEVLVDVEAGISALEIAGAIARHAMTQREVLRSRRRANGIGLHEAEYVERPLQRGRWEKAARDGGTTQVVESHSAPLSMRKRLRPRRRPASAQREAGEASRIKRVGMGPYARVINE